MVPYGGCICSLKERIAELFDIVGEKLHSINGVQGDGAGDVKIVSGDAAVVISNDQIGHKIEVGLDKSKLPSAAVPSVNGKTGAVFLKARDIPSDGHSNVQDDIDSSRTSITALAGDTIMERQARQKADAALQTNINRVQASMPEAAAAAVSNNPTVARLASEVPNKLDKITGGSTKRAYTHTGSVQDDTPAVNGTDANSIGLRDANGRMQAADPAAGATDKTLVTANWVSQTGDDAPNNLAHRNGNETWRGEKIFISDPTFMNTIRSKTAYAREEAAGKSKFILSIFDLNGILLGGLTIKTGADGKSHIGVYVYDTDGTWHGSNII